MSLPTLPSSTPGNYDVLFSLGHAEQTVGELYASLQDVDQRLRSSQRLLEQMSALIPQPAS